MRIELLFIITSCAFIFLSSAGANQSVRDGARRIISDMKEKAEDRCSYDKWPKIPENGHRLVSRHPMHKGFADRMTGMATAYLFALLTNRTFYIEKAPGAVGFNEFLDFEYPWYQPDLGFYPNSSQTDGSHEIDVVDKSWPKVWNVFINISDTRYETIFIQSNRGAIRLILSEKRLQTRIAELGLDRIKPADLFGCILNFIFQPKPRVFKNIDPIITAMDTLEDAQNDTVCNTKTLRISIHIRLDDLFLVNKNVSDSRFGKFWKRANVTRFFDCAKQIEAWALEDNCTYRRDQVVWALFSDSEPVRKRAIEMYPDRIHVSQEKGLLAHFAEKCTHSNISCGVSKKDRIAFSLAEWYLISLGDYFVLTERSGFGSTAALRGFKGDSIFVIPTHVKPNGVKCDRNDRVSFSKLSSKWAGI